MLSPCNAPANESSFPSAVSVPSLEEPTAHHFGVTVTDLDRAVEFYRDVLGLNVLDRFMVSDEAFTEGVGVDAATGSFAHLNARLARVELVEYESGGVDRDAERINQPGAKHLGLAVDDLERFYAELPPDAETISEPQTTASRTRILFLHGPEDNLIEPVEA